VRIVARIQKRYDLMPRYDWLGKYIEAATRGGESGT